MSRKTPEEIRKMISAPLSSDPLERQKQKVQRKALILQLKGSFVPPSKRQAPVKKPKSKPKVVQAKPKKSDGGMFGLAQTLRDRFPE